MDIINDTMSDSFEDFESITEVNMSVDLVQQILMLQAVDKSIEYIEEKGADNGWDSDLRDGMTDYLIAERELIKSDIMETYHEAVLADNEDAVGDMIPTPVTTNGGPRYSDRENDA